MTVIKAVVGAGGKTTLIHKLAKEYLAQGKKVFVTTATHMYREENTFITEDAELLIRELERTGYVMAGTDAGEQTGKIRELPYEVYEKICRYADIVLIEADGSKHMPLKVPAAYEPVIYPNVDEIIVVCGMHAIGKTAGETVHRLELAKDRLGIREETVITEELIRELVRTGYTDPLKQKYPDKKLSVYEAQDLSGNKQQKDSDFRQKVQIGCVIMASGLSVRFGSSKLLAEFKGKTLIQNILDLTEGLFAKRVVVTRNKEVEAVCREQQVDVIFHQMPDRSDTVRIGTEQMKEMDGCLFCPCDQPLLRRESLQEMIRVFEKKKHGIIRIAHGDRQGTPVLFGQEFFQELLSLPPKCGGSQVIRQHPEAVTLVMAGNDLELFDIDTKEDYEWLKKQAEQQE